MQLWFPSEHAPGIPISLAAMPGRVVPARPSAEGQGQSFDLPARSASASPTPGQPALPLLLTP
ncbi:MAG: hypothetical protein D6811_05420 [Alphaproteobacteria bacterium]|nr:MAG: hypothetical protein D6811_05420 [Alphaproteobacteria bacterium]